LAIQTAFSCKSSSELTDSLSSSLAPGERLPCFQLFFYSFNVKSGCVGKVFGICFLLIISLILKRMSSTRKARGMCWTELSTLLPNCCISSWEYSTRQSSGHTDGLIVSFIWGLSDFCRAFGFESTACLFLDGLREEGLLYVPAFRGLTFRKLDDEPYLD
jgi:hypothetical protein